MLRRMKIGGRVNVLIAVPLLALIAFAAISYVALQNASVRGDEYAALKQAQDLRADTLPPPASLLGAWAEVNVVGVLAASPDGFTPDVQSEIATHVRAIDTARVDFEQSMDFWAQQNLDQRVQIRFIDMGRDAGDKFFEAVDAELKPAIASGDPLQVLSVIRSLEWRYDLQQTGVQRALDWAENEVLVREASTDDYVGKVILFAGAGAALLALATLLLSVRVRRLIVRPIRALAAQAKMVASHDLPAAVASVHDLPADAEVPHLPPFEVATNDELAELAMSFTSVQDAAVDLAAEQARARRVVSENLVNIARRNQNLLGRTLGFISNLEQSERDPEVLDNLFRIDHLTTRMRRNAQSLLVLAGAEPTRLWAPPVPIGDVVRAALSEVENYGQVELADVGEVAVQGSISGEVSHLLAELLENSTSYSPPNSTVTVVGRAVPDGHQLAIFDYGLGMTAEDLADANRRLNEVGSFDRESNRMLGFQVVARLAARHDIKVMLTTTPGGTGVTAIIRLPKSALESPAASAPEAPVVDLPTASALLTQPLPVVAPMTMEPVTLESIEHSRPTEMSDDDLWASMHSAQTAPPMENVIDDAIDAVTASGLPKRVRGAQLPDLGTPSLDTTPTRVADDVRTTLASLQRGIDLGRQHGTDD
jgi:HAMP domain